MMTLKLRPSGKVLFVCVGLMLCGSCFLAGTTVRGILRVSYYFWISDLGVELGATVVLVAGAVLCLPASWMAYMVPYYPRSMTLQITLMCLVTSSMLVLSVGLSSLGGLSRALHGPGYDSLNATMQQAMACESSNPAIRNAFASMQLELKCCGALSPCDWLHYRKTFPPSCCNRTYYTQQYGIGPLVDAKRTDQCDVPTFTRGCLTPAVAELRSFVNSTSSLTATVIVTLAVTMFISAYIMVSTVKERCERAKSLTSSPLRLACVHNLPNPLAPSPISAGQFHAQAQLQNI